MKIIETTAFVLRDKEGRIILQHRDEKAPRFPECWAFFGGGIEEGETPEEAVRREAKEELDIELRNLKFFRKYEVQIENEFYRIFVFIAPLLTSLEKLRKQQTEGNGLGLFSFEETKTLKIPDFERNMFKDLFNKR